MSDTESELVLEPPRAATEVTPEQAASTIKIDRQTEQQIDGAVRSFVESLSSLDAKSPEFEQKLKSIRGLGNDEIRRSAEVSDRFLDRPTTALQRGPLAEGSQVGNALLALRRQIEDLEPARNNAGHSRGLMSRLPFGNRARDYFHKYQSAQGNIEGIIQGLYRGQDELMRDNAALEQEKVNLWATKGRLEEYIYMASKLDEAVETKIRLVELSDGDKARALKEDVLFYVRQKRQDLLTQLAVNVQGYLALDIIRKNNLELIKGVERATTTTVSALRTAVIAALALGNQRLVLDQVTALNTTTGNLIESTSAMLRKQTGEIQNQAASATINVEQLQKAFDNVYATIESIDQFKLAALDTMKRTIDTLSTQVARSRAYIDRARASEAGQARVEALHNELSLPPSAAGKAG